MKDRVTPGSEHKESGIPEQFGDLCKKLAERRKDLSDVQNAIDHPNWTKRMGLLLDELAIEQRGRKNIKAILLRPAFMKVNVERYRGKCLNELEAIMRPMLTEASPRAGVQFTQEILENMSLLVQQWDLEFVEFNPSEVGFTSEFGRNEMYRVCDELGIDTMSSTEAVIAWLELDPKCEAHRYFLMCDRIHPRNSITTYHAMLHTSCYNDGQHILSILGSGEEKTHYPDEVWVYRRYCK